MASKKRVSTKNLRAPKPTRSPKAGRPPEQGVSSPRVRRRQKSAHVAFAKDTTLHEAADGPRVVWGVTKPKVKKR
ncbi:MAG TPA: hypothetical protein VFN71_02610 [Methylomirabilota bacterium]|nr:hypothetical protein [Methylomirabilota bacterium]